MKKKTSRRQRVEEGEAEKTTRRTRVVEGNAQKAARKKQWRKSNESVEVDHACDTDRPAVVGEVVKLLSFEQNDQVGQCYITRHKGGEKPDQKAHHGSGLDAIAGNLYNFEQHGPRQNRQDHQE